ncbi:hypothetical protein [Pedobacter aquatilis]|nr:hypothetical protein [Pedobacter aquatilis]
MKQKVGLQLIWNADVGFPDDLGDVVKRDWLFEMTNFYFKLIAYTQVDL